MDITTMTISTILAFARIGSFLFFIPMLRNPAIPPMAKVVITFIISVSIADRVGEVPVNNVPEMIALIVIQIAIGLTLAFIIEIIFSSIRVAGGLLDLDMGFAASEFVDPSSGQRTTILSNFLYLLFSIVFLMLGGLQNVIAGIVFSFRFTKPETFFLDISLLEFVLGIVLYMFTAGVQIALPVTASMFIVNIIMLIIGNSAKEMGVFNHIFIVKIAIGLTILFILLPYIGDLFVQMNEVLMEKLIEALDVIFKDR